MAWDSWPSAAPDGTTARRRYAACEVRDGKGGEQMEGCCSPTVGPVSRPGTVKVVGLGEGALADVLIRSLRAGSPVPFESRERQGRRSSPPLFVEPPKPAASHVLDRPNDSPPPFSSISIPPIDSREIGTHLPAYSRGDVACAIGVVLRSYLSKSHIFSMFRSSFCIYPAAPSQSGVQSRASYLLVGRASTGEEVLHVKFRDTRWGARSWGFEPRTKHHASTMNQSF